MANLSIPYGKSFLNLTIPQEFSYDLITPPDTFSPDKSTNFIQGAINFPVNNYQIGKLDGTKKIAIAVNDKTRPVPINDLLPPLIQHLIDLGASKNEITIIIATGTHVPMPNIEFPLLFNKDIINNYHIISHNCDDLNNLISIGITNQGTPVSINKMFYEADIKIVVGSIEPHHFMGFSGGAKSASIGLTSRSTINKNHEMLLDPQCSVGRYENNPMRMDVEEIGDLIGIDCALNCILNRKKEIISVLFGRPRSVMEKGIKIVNSTCRVNVEHKYDIVIASPGGYPKDINLYQAQKAMTHAALIIKDQGIIVLVAECIEGSGSLQFEEFMEGISSYEEVFNKFQKLGFSIGPHKAFQIARETSRVKIMIKSVLPDNLSKKFLLFPINDINNSIRDLLTEHKDPPSIAIMPNAINTIPKLVG